MGNIFKNNMLTDTGGSGKGSNTDLVAEKKRIEDAKNAASGNKNAGGGTTASGSGTATSSGSTAGSTAAGSTSGSTGAGKTVTITRSDGTTVTGKIVDGHTVVDGGLKDGDVVHTGGGDYKYSSSTNSGTKIEQPATSGGNAVAGTANVVKPSQIKTTGVTDTGTGNATAGITAGTTAVKKTSGPKSTDSAVNSGTTNTPEINPNVVKPSQVGTTGYTDTGTGNAASATSAAEKAADKTINQETESGKSFSGTDAKVVKPSQMGTVGYTDTGTGNADAAKEAAKAAADKTIEQHLNGLLGYDDDVENAVNGLSGTDVGDTGNLAERNADNSTAGVVNGTLGDADSQNDITNQNVETADPEVQFNNFENIVTEYPSVIITEDGTIDFSNMNAKEASAAIMNLVQTGTVDLDKFMTWAEAYAMAYETLGASYDADIENALKSLQGNALANGFYGQIPYESIRANALATAEVDKMKAIAEYAKELKEYDADEALSKFDALVAQNKITQKNLIDVLNLMYQMESDEADRKYKYDSLAQDQAQFDAELAYNKERDAAKNANDAAKNPKTYTGTKTKASSSEPDLDSAAYNGGGLTVGDIMDLQEAYNAQHPNNKIAVDGSYGPESKAAFGTDALSAYKQYVTGKTNNSNNSGYKNEYNDFNTSYNTTQ